jgi:hypothetical protein
VTAVATPRPDTERSSRLIGLVVLILLLALTALSVLALRPPPPVAADAPVQDFSAERAFAHVQRIAGETHVAGSAAGDRVVGYLEETLTGLGLDTRVQNAVGTYQAEVGSAEMARVQNVVAVLPGTASTGRVVLMAHHDSVETGPGASDDASGVSAVLESVRAVTAGEPLRNDLVVVLTDAEEACLCGAEAFAARHPLAAEGGVVLNLEARGTTGPPIMFETSVGNAGLAQAYAAAAPHPVASSFAVEVYRTLPNDTDFSVLLADGDFTGLNTAFIDGAAAYHTPQDTPDRLDRGSLQAHGDNALALVRELGGTDLAPLAQPAAEDATYFPVLDRLVRYPGSLVWPLAIASLVAVALAVLVARVRGETTLRRTLAATVLAALPLVLAPLAVQGMWRVMVAVRPGYAAMLDPWRPGPYRLAAVALVAAVVLLWYALLRGRVGAVALWSGALVWLAVLAAVLAEFAPGGAYLATWPALAGAVALLLTVATRARVVRAVAAVVAGGIAAVVLAPTVALFLPALGLASGAAPAAVATLLAVALLPAFELLFPVPGRRLAAAVVPATAAVLAAGLVVAGLLVDTFDARHPVPSQLVYALDADSGQAWWVSTEDDPGAYTAGYVGRRGDLPVDFPYLEGELALGDAEPADLPAPELTVDADARVGDARRFTVTVAPQRGVRLLALEVRTDGGSVTSAAAEGRDVAPAALGSDRLFVTFHAPPDEGVRFTVEVQGGGPVTLRAVDGSDGLDGLPGFEPRPDDVDAAGTHSSDLVVVSRSTVLG